MNKDASIFLAGHQGLVGSAIERCLKQNGFTNVITRQRNELDLTDQACVGDFFAREQPEYVFVAAAHVGGIHANSTYPADFIRINLQIQTNVIDNAYRSGVKKLLFLGSSCIYPKESPQPIREESLLAGPLEPTNLWYAVAKIAGIKMCQAYRRQYGMNTISVMPTNLYGPRDNFHLDNAHVIPALMHRFHLAKERGDATVTVWGSGRPRREFLYVDDLADACLFLMENYEDEEVINVGVGEDVAIADLAALLKDVVGYRGEIVLDTSKPDGVMSKLLDVSRINALGWKPKTPLADGLVESYRWFLDNLDDIVGKS